MFLKARVKRNVGCSMANIEPTILTNMCMIYDGSRILVQDRKNPDWPGVTFPGGHVEPKESFVDSTIREVYEETGLTISNLKLCGVKQFTHRRGDYRYIVFLYKTDTFSGDLTSSREGDVFWVERSMLTEYQLAEGFLDMLEIFENDTLSEDYLYFENETWHQINK